MQNASTMYTRMMTDAQKADALTAAIAAGWVEHPEYAGSWHHKDDPRTYGYIDTLELASNFVTPVVGLPVTVNVGSDRYGAEITKVSPTGAYIEIKYDPTHAGVVRTERANRSKTRPVYLVGGRSTVNLGYSAPYRDPSF